MCTAIAAHSRTWDLIIHSFIQLSLNNYSQDKNSNSQKQQKHVTFSAEHYRQAKASSYKDHLVMMRKVHI